MGFLDVEAALRAGRVGPLIGHAEHAEGVAARRYAIDLAGRAILLADPGTVGAELRTRARALGIEEATIAACDEQPPPHAVRLPLVDGARADAFVRMLWVEFDPSEHALDRPALDHRARAAVGDALARAAEVAPPLRPLALFRLVAARPRALEGVSLEGSSLAAAALVSAVSLWSERPVRAGLAITGAIAGDRIVRVGAIDAKVRAAIEAGCEAIVVPHECVAEAAQEHVRVIGVRTIEELLEATLARDRTSIDPESAARDARTAFAEGWRGYRWPSIAERLARTSSALPEGRPDLRVEVLARLAAARRHLGDPEGSLRVLEAAIAIADASDAVPDGPSALLLQQLAMTELKLFRVRAAAKAAERAIRIARQARLRGAIIKGLGCAGVVALARGDAPSARDAFEDALMLTMLHAPGDTARSRVYLLDALGRLEQEDDARAQWLEAMREIDAGDARARRAKESWVRTGWGGALVAMGRFDEAIEVLDVAAVHESLHEDPLPGLLARRHLGCALARGTRAAMRDRGLELLAASPLAHGRALEPGLRSVAQVNVLVEAQTRIALGRWDADAEVRTTAALDALPQYGAAARWLGPPRREVARAMAKGGPDLERLAVALRALIARCEAI